MILRHGSVPAVPRSAEAVASHGALARVTLSDAGGLSQFGVHLDELQPGTRSSDRHWHEQEDEFLLMLAGEATMLDDDGPHLLTAGDAVCWPAGGSNAHHVWNRSGAPCRYLIVGTRLADDVVHYPDSGRTQIDSQGKWRVVGPDGKVLRQGDTPAEKRADPDDIAWHRAKRGTPRTLIVPRGTAEIDRATPEQNAVMGAFEASLLSYGSAISHYGAFVETLYPGARSSDRHWHEREDEFLLMLEGQATVVENDGPHLLGPLDAACWPAGVANGHHLRNLTGAPCRYLIVGWRSRDDVVHYSDMDKLYVRKDGLVARTRRDGSPL